MGMNDALDFGIGPVNFAVDGKLIVPFALTGERVALEIDQNQLVFCHLLQTNTRTLDPLMARSIGQGRDVAVDHVVVTLHGENTTSQREFFLDLQMAPPENCIVSSLA